MMNKRVNKLMIITMQETACINKNDVLREKSKQPHPNRDFEFMSKIYVRVKDVGKLYTAE